MIGLLDSDFLRNLEKLDRLYLLRTSKFDFIIPTNVYNELKLKGIPYELDALIESMYVRKESCTKHPQLKELNKFKPHSGEREAMCIALNLDPKECIIFTNDRRAQRTSSQLGISTLEIVMFLVSCNKCGLLTKTEALEDISVLEGRKYRMPKDDIISQLE